MSHDTNTTIPKTAHAVRVHAFGGNEETRYQQVPVTPPGEGEVLVRVAGAGVNPVDWKIVRGYLGAFLPTTMPFVPGWEIGRTIVARGHAARRFEVGAPVYNYIHSPTVEHGAYAEFVTVPEAYLAAAPTSLSLVEAAGVPLAGLTAYQCLHDATSLKPSETVVILGASGGVGGFAVQIAKAHGARVIAVASAANRDYCAGLGADDFIAYNEGPLTAAFEARKATADVILDCSGGARPSTPAEPRSRRAGASRASRPRPPPRDSRASRITTSSSSRTAPSWRPSRPSLTPANSRCTCTRRCPSQALWRPSNRARADTRAARWS